MPQSIDGDSPDTATDDRCPRCGAASANVHGLVDCPNCAWTDSIDR